MRRWARAGAVVLVAGVAACAGPRVTGAGGGADKIEGLYAYGAAGRDLALVVDGNPFPAPDAAFRRALEAMVQGGGMLPPTHPTLTPGETARPPYKLAFAFNPAEPATPDTVCAGRAVPQPPGDRLRVEAAFCYGDRPLTGAMGDVSGVASADDARFHALIRDVMFTLFRRDRTDHGRARFP